MANCYKQDGLVQQKHLPGRLEEGRGEEEDEEEEEKRIFSSNLFVYKTVCRYKYKLIK